jgi:exopolysaccharide biosynthesis polyprenyl glycosylphosphotransferase
MTPASTATQSLSQSYTTIPLAAPRTSRPSPLSPPAGSAAVTATPHLARASINIRRHVLRVALRHGILLTLDVAAILILDQVVFRTAAVPWIGQQFMEVVGSSRPAIRLATWPVVMGLLLALAIAGNYGAGDRRRDPARLFLGCALGLALPLWNMLWSIPTATLAQLVVGVALLTAALYLSRSVLDVLLHYTVPTRSAAPRTLLVGPGAECLALFGRSAFSDEYGFRLVGCIDTTSPQYAALDELADRLGRELLEQQIDTVVLCGGLSDPATAQVMRAATIAECELLVTSPTLELPGVHPSLVWRRGQPFIELRAAALRGHQLFAKRALDLVVASVSLLAVAPVMFVVALAVRLESPGPVVFGQRRLGRHGHVFRCYKFRSMRRDAEEVLRADPELYAEYVRNDYKLPPERDTRITRVGRFLRRSSLDELPQLWNVVRGDMSLVGPRPIVVDELRHYGREQPLFLSLPPGVTGAWQVNGRSSVAYPDRAAVELEYVRTWNLGSDLRILALTLPAVLAQRGAH